MAHITGDTYLLGPEDVGLQVSVRVTLQGPSGREAKSDATSSMVRVDPCPSPSPYPHPNANPNPNAKPNPSPSPSPSPGPQPHPSPDQVGVGESYKAQLTEWSVRQGERAFAVLMPSLGEKVTVRVRVRVRVRVGCRAHALSQTESLRLFNAGPLSLTLAVTP